MRRRKHGFIKDCTRQLQVFLENRNIPYKVTRSRSSSSQYWLITCGEKEYCVRISDHPPSAKAQDFSLHPGSRSQVTHVRIAVRHAWKRSIRQREIAEKNNLKPKKEQSLKSPFKLTQAQIEQAESEAVIYAEDTPFNHTELYSEWIRACERESEALNAQTVYEDMLRSHPDFHEDWLR